MKTLYKYQLAIKLGKIKNIMMRQKTCFQIRLTVYNKNEANQNVLAGPYECFSLDSSSKNESELLSGEILPDNYLSPKKLIVNSADIFINTVCIFKGQIVVPQKKNFKPEIIVYAQLFWSAGKEPELIGDWTGHTNAFCLESGMQIYFSNHFASCVIDASIHCLISEIKLQKEELFNQLEMTKKYYNIQEQKLMPLYHTAIDPLVVSINKLLKWNEKLQQGSVLQLNQSFKSKKIHQWKYFRLDRLLEVSLDDKAKDKNKIDYPTTLQRLQASEYLQCLKADAYRISQEIFIGWKKFLNLMQKQPKHTYFQQLSQIYKEKVQKNHWTHHYQLYSDPDNKRLEYISQFDRPDQQLEFQSFQRHNCQIKLSFQDLKSISHQISKENDHVLVLVHGFQASSFDMELIAAYFKHKNPCLHLMISQTNEGRTDTAIEECGHRLALEVKNYLNTKGLKSANISFIGHSLGGLIIRASLKYLQLYKNNFAFYISLCSPHLGYLYHTSKIITTSLWVMNMVKKDQSMIELTMGDKQDLTKTFLYGLTQCGELNWFEKIVLLGSKEDEYVPFGSAMLLDRQFFYETSSAKIHQSMYQNLVQPIADKIIRLQIVFKDKITDLSGFIGRTAHIKTLSHLPIIDLYVNLISKLF